MSRSIVVIVKFREISEKENAILKKEVNFMNLINIVVLVIIAIELALIYVRLGEGKK